MGVDAALVASKAAAASLFFVAALCGAAVPFLLEKCKLGRRISHLNAFAAGRCMYTQTQQQKQTNKLTFIIIHKHTQQIQSPRVYAFTLGVI